MNRLILLDQLQGIADGLKLIGLFAIVLIGIIIIFMIWIKKEYNKREK